MDIYTRKVLDTFKDYITNQELVTDERILDLKKEIATAATSARIKGLASETLEQLYEDVEFIGGKL